jgi:hypothetical protein
MQNLKLERVWNRMQRWIPVWMLHQKLMLQVRPRHRMQIDQSQHLGPERWYSLFQNHYYQRQVSVPMNQTPMSRMQRELLATLLLRKRKARIERQHRMLKVPNRTQLASQLKHQRLKVRTKRRMQTWREQHQKQMVSQRPRMQTRQMQTLSLPA